MKFWLATLVLASACCAARGQQMPYGQAEYLNSCAVCHGKTGEGDGPLAEQLIKRPADLTQLRALNHGEFPYWRVFSVIDGRFIVPGHGDREMPVWGQAFVDEDAKKFGPIGGEAVSEERIHQITEFIQTLQQ